MGQLGWVARVAPAMQTASGDPSQAAASARAGAGWVRVRYGPISVSSYPMASMRLLPLWCM
jgi:hypothetical protein